MDIIKDKILKTNKGYFFDTDTEYYLKLSDEIANVIEAPSSDFQEEGERWQTVEDLVDDMLGKMPALLTPDVDENGVCKVCGNKTTVVYNIGLKAISICDSCGRSIARQEIDSMFEKKPTNKPDVDEKVECWLNPRKHEWEWNDGERCKYCKVERHSL